MNNLELLLEMLSINGGAIVSTASLSPKTIQDKKDAGVMYVNERGLGYVWVSKDEALSWAVNDNQTT